MCSLPAQAPCSSPRFTLSLTSPLFCTTGSFRNAFTCPVYLVNFATCQNSRWDSEGCRAGYLSLRTADVLDQLFSVVRRPVHCGMFAPLAPTCTPGAPLSFTPSCGNQNCHQTLSHAPWRAAPPMTENPCIRGIIPDTCPESQLCKLTASPRNTALWEPQGPLHCSWALPPTSIKAFGGTEPDAVGHHSR